MNDNWARGLFRLFLATAFALTTPTLFAAEATNASRVSPQARPSASPKPSDALQFIDGSLLHGELRSVDRTKGVRWAHSDALNAVDFTPTNIGWIRFASAKPPQQQNKPTCRFRFSNGDEVFGSLASLDSDIVELETWFGGRMKAPRNAVQSLTFLSKGFSILYEGPTGLEGWNLGRGQPAWEFADGELVARQPGTLGRDFKMAGSSSIEFDLGWAGQFSLLVVLYTDVVDHFDYSTVAYMFYIGPGYLTLQRIQPNTGSTSLGQATFRPMALKNKVHLEFRCNKEEATITGLIDGTVVQKWKDPAGFVAKGSGVLFFPQLPGPIIRLGNIKVSEWDGRFETEGTNNVPQTSDMIYLANRDKVTGQLRHVRDGKAGFTAAETKLDIPVERITQILLQPRETNVVQEGAWSIRTFFASGGAVAFELDKWNPQQVSGKSTIFGQVALNPQSIRQVQFNLNRSSDAAENVSTSTDEFGFDE
jgi:hypothetical protein